MASDRRRFVRGGEQVPPDYLLLEVARFVPLRLAAEPELVEQDGSPALTDRTCVGAAIGTPCYMSPEQAKGKVSALGPRSDVYSAGAMLYHLLTGQLPFSGASLGETMQRLVNEPPTAIARFNYDVGSSLAVVEPDLSEDIAATGAVELDRAAVAGLQ